jgi:hypothetical protein
MSNTEERETVLDLPIPHIWDDGSVSELRLTRRAYDDCFALHSAWVNDPEFPPEEWIDEVRLGHTRLGYEQWLEEAREASGALALNSYTISLAVTVSAYGTVTVQAESLAAALEKVRVDAAAASSGCGQTLWDEVSDIDWSTQGDYRVLTAVSDADVSDAAAGIDLVTDSFDVISAEHLAMLLAEGQSVEGSAK